MPKLSEQKVFSVIGSLYEAAREATTEAWLEVYLQLAELVDSGAGGFSIYDTSQDRFHTAISTLDPALVSDYFKYYQHASHARKTIAKLKVGERYNRAEHISDREFKESAIYRDFYLPADIFHLEYQVFLVRPGVHGGVAFSRPEGKPNFGSHELEVMSMLLPHLERAFQIYVNLIDIGTENKVLTDAFDHIPRNVMVIDSSLTVLFANSGAKELLANKDGLEVRNGSLATFSSREEKKIRAVLERMFSGPRRRGDALLISRPSGQRPLEILLTPLAEDMFRTIGREPMALAFVSDPERNQDTTEAILQRMYGLTPSEARLAALLTDGRSLKDVCDVLSIKTSTARTHLKRVFAKTDTKRQSELLKLILNGPANLQLRRED